MSAQRNALGRGLGALISKRQAPNTPDDGAPEADAREEESEAPPVALREDAPSATPPETPEIGRESANLGSDTESGQPSADAPGDKELRRVRVDLIDPNPDQPRRVFDPARLEELAQSIARSGVLQPVVVTRNGERYTLLVGERRWRASRAAGQETIPAVIADADPEERLELAIVENVQRHDLNPIELAHAYRALAERGATQDEIGRRVGKDRSSIANLLRLLELPVDMQSDVESGRLSMGHAKALLQVTDEARRRELRDRAVDEGLSVRQTESAGRELAGPSTRGGRPRQQPQEAAAEGATDPDLQRLEEILCSHFQGRVKIHGTREQGRIEIRYTSGEDLDRTTRLILEGM